MLVIEGKSMELGTEKNDEKAVIDEKEDEIKVSDILEVFKDNLIDYGKNFHFLYFIKIKQKFCKFKIVEMEDCIIYIF